MQKIDMRGRYKITFAIHGVFVTASCHHGQADGKHLGDDFQLTDRMNVLLNYHVRKIVVISIAGSISAFVNHSCITFLTSVSKQFVV